MIDIDINYLASIATLIGFPILILQFIWQIIDRRRKK